MTKIKKFDIFYVVVILRDLVKRRIYSRKARDIYHCGDNGGEDPPVLIPNTEVKLTSAENTILVTIWEDRKLPHPKV